jgi:hypothetical protein
MIMSKGRRVWEVYGVSALLAITFWSVVALAVVTVARLFI